MNTVHLRFNDAATGQPTPVRLLVHDAHSVARHPLGRLQSFETAPGRAVGGQVKLTHGLWSYIDGTCEMPLPAGKLLLQASKGPEYRPFVAEPTLASGQISLRFALDRWIDLRGEGWYSGDTHALMLTPHGALLEGAAEGLAVVNLLACYWHDSASGLRSLPNIEAFSGTQPALASPGHLVVVNTLNTHPVLGTLALLNSHRPVYPLRCGDQEKWWDWTLEDWCGQCHRKKGLVVWSDPRSLHPDRNESRLFAEATANAILGQIDAFEITQFDAPETPDLRAWTLLQQAGVRIPLVGGSAKNSNATLLGAVRTYAHLQPTEELTYAAWIAAIRAGRTFITNGPLLTLQTNGVQPGAILETHDGVVLNIEATVRSMVAVDRVEVLWNGEVIAERTGDKQLPTTIRLESKHVVSGPGWLSARCYGCSFLAVRQRLFAHTSPVYVQVQGERLRPSTEACRVIHEQLRRIEQWAATEAVNDRQRQHLTETLTGARKRLDEARA